MNLTDGRKGSTSLLRQTDIHLWKCDPYYATVPCLQDLRRNLATSGEKAWSSRDCPITAWPSTSVPMDVYGAGPVEV
ncbi:hypothetical protein E2C01_048221 [Portunus trituberculatus]|uniref:Uncharacterized protein n=1 Tax=Portunus trituberculatus TaxID=210409 RepID=A0A5B7G345_PORTR|nr:hypothetical protein [Portunus trituberculatus]